MPYRAVAGAIKRVRSLCQGVVRSASVHKKDFKTFDGSDPIETANLYVSKQVSDFYKHILNRLNER